MGRQLKLISQNFGLCKFGYKKIIVLKKNENPVDSARPVPWLFDFWRVLAKRGQNIEILGVGEFTFHPSSYNLPIAIRDTIVFEPVCQCQFPFVPPKQTDHTSDKRTT